MSKVITYYLSLNSPWSFLGAGRLKEIAKRHGAHVDVRPVNLGKVFGETGGLPLPKRSPQRQEYRLVELARWRDALGIPIVIKPAYFPSDERLGAAMVYAAGDLGGDALGLATAIGHALWVEERDIADQQVLTDIATKLGFNTEKLLARAADPDIRDRFEMMVEQAIADGVFGAPSYIYNGELFWGQDRIEFLDRALAAR